MNSQPPTSNTTHPASAPFGLLHLNAVPGHHGICGPWKNTTSVEKWLADTFGSEIQCTTVFGNSALLFGPSLSKDYFPPDPTSRRYCEVDRRAPSPESELLLEVMAKEVSLALNGIQQGRLSSRPRYQPLPADTCAWRIDVHPAIGRLAASVPRST